jgi:hypothetical protein
MNRCANRAGDQPNKRAMVVLVQNIPSKKVASNGALTGRSGRQIAILPDWLKNTRCQTLQNNS